MTLSFNNPIMLLGLLPLIVVAGAWIVRNKPKFRTLCAVCMLVVGASFLIVAVAEPLMRIPTQTVAFGAPEPRPPVVAGMSDYVRIATEIMEYGAPEPCPSVVPGIRHVGGTYVHPHVIERHDPDAR